MQVRAFERSLALRNRNVAVEARVIALFAASHRPKSSWVREPERMRLRDLLKERSTRILRMESAAPPKAAVHYGSWSRRGA